MLTVLGLGMILCFMYLIMSKRLSPLVALTLIPLLFALIAWLLGFYFDSLSHIQINEIGDMMIEGVKKTCTDWHHAAFCDSVFCHHD